MKFLTDKITKAIENGETLVLLCPADTLDEDPQLFVDDIINKMEGNPEVHVIRYDNSAWRVYVHDNHGVPWLALFHIEPRPCNSRYIQPNGYCPQCNQMHAIRSATKKPDETPPPVIAKKRTLEELKQWWREQNAENIAKYKPPSERTSEGAENIWYTEGE